jgi:hypothetical protein
VGTGQGLTAVPGQAAQSAGSSSFREREPTAAPDNFDGDGAPGTVYQAPRQDFGPPRARTAGRSGHSGRPLLGAGDCQLITLDEARQRMPDVTWPDDLEDGEVVRFYDGDVHVADTTALLDDHDASGYWVAIRGDLTVDGTLDATAGGDGYGSLLAVEGDVRAQAAIFIDTIAAEISGTLEVATVVMCYYGGHGGYLYASTVRAQVVSYSSNFPRPEAEIDAFCITDEDDEDDEDDVSFPAARGREVFFTDVLKNGFLDEPTAATWLREGRPILRDA